MQIVEYPVRNFISFPFLIIHQLLSQVSKSFRYVPTSTSGYAKVTLLIVIVDTDIDHVKF